MGKSVEMDKLYAPLIKQLQLPAEFITTINEIYFPLAQIIVNKKDSSPLLVSINGLQGSGKSTLTQFLKVIIESQFNKNVIEFSIDDFYLTKLQRQELSNKVHPLLSTRGVPGTHDIYLLEQILDDLLSHRSCLIPRFDKSVDDRFSEEYWTSVTQPIDIILFEGWCNNSPVQSESDLTEPVNELEANEDSEGIWRHYVNTCLQDYHQRVFNQVDLTVMLQPSSFDCVFEWRKLQEKKIQRESDVSTSMDAEKKCVMNDQSLRRFIQHYERISRHTLSHLPQQVDLLLPVNELHCMTAIKRKQM